MRLAITAVSALALVTIAGALPGTADARGMDSHYSRTFNVCQQRATSNVDIGACYQAEGRRWDADLNATYQQVMARLSPHRQNDLRADERTWIAGRDAKCQRAGDAMGGGSGTGIAILSCTLDETIRRTLFLKSYR
jgi:uncharacterized protein YecT (DUF1311 family)